MRAPLRLGDVAGTGTAKEVSDARYSGQPKSDETLKELLVARRSLEEALADFQEKYQHAPSPDLARKIELLREEIEVRKPPVKPSEAVYDPVPDRTGPALARMLPWWRRVILMSRRWIRRSL
jgi:hypothetical protein